MKILGWGFLGFQKIVVRFMPTSDPQRLKLRSYGIPTKDIQEESG